MNNDGYEDSVREFGIITALLILTIVSSCVYEETRSVPDRISMWCKTQHEVRGTSVDECIESYKQHREVNK